MLYDPKWKEKLETPIMNEPWRELLRSAAEIIKTKGWCQRRMELEDGRVCTLGAMVKSPWMSEALLQADARLSRYVGANVVSWNDAPGRTKEEVVETLLHVANT